MGIKYGKHPNAPLNKIRIIDPRNPRLSEYLEAAKKFLAEERLQ